MCSGGTSVRPDNAIVTSRGLNTYCNVMLWTNVFWISVIENKNYPYALKNNGVCVINVPLLRWRNPRLPVFKGRDGTRGVGGRVGENGGIEWYRPKRCCHPRRIIVNLKQTTTWQQQPTDPLRWRHNGHDCVSNHQPRHCLLNRLCERRSKKTSKLRVTGLCAWNSPGTGEFPHKWPVTRKMFPFDDVIMLRGVHFLYDTCNAMQTQRYLDHLDQVTHVCVGNLTIIDSDNNQRLVGAKLLSEPMLEYC